MPYLNRWFFAEVLEGIQQALLERGLDLTLYDAKPGTPGRERIFGDFLARKRFDGLIAVGLEPVDHEIEQLTRIEGRSSASSARRGDERRRRRRRPRGAAGDRAPDRARTSRHRVRRRVAAQPLGASTRSACGLRHAMREAGLSELRPPTHLRGVLPAATPQRRTCWAIRAPPTAIVGVATKSRSARSSRPGASASRCRRAQRRGHRRSRVRGDVRLTTLQQVPREQGGRRRVLLAEIADLGRAHRVRTPRASSCAIPRQRPAEPRGMTRAPTRQGALGTRERDYLR
jgi:hypothetical protein